MKENRLPKVIAKYTQLITAIGFYFDLSALDVIDLLKIESIKGGSIVDQKMNCMYDAYRLGFVRGYAAGKKTDKR